jgi:hypothetical protein
LAAYPVGYEKDNILYVYDQQDRLLNRTSVKDLYYPLVWSYDSKKIYFCEQAEGNITYCFEIEKGIKKRILISKRVYFHPLTVLNENILFFLENTIPDEAGAICNIVKYNLLSKKFEKIKLPKIEDLNIFQAYTISPNGKIALFENTTDGFIYVVDISKIYIIDKIELAMNSSPEAFSWSLDSSYVTFTMTWKEIYKYTIPKQ